MHRHYLLGILCGCISLAQAQTVSMGGTLGATKALLVIDGTPHSVAVGATAQGVRLLRLQPDEATIEIGGKTVSLRLGAAHANGPSSNAPATGKRIVLTAGQGGHFMSSGQVNGKSIQFMVDTGASLVTLSQTQADSLGIKYRDGPKVTGRTANGEVEMHRVKLQSVRMGEVQLFEIEAVVVPAEMPFALLGNSFLSRFQMKRENDQMTLERRY
jgi:aspartyl protease family protein